MANLLTPALVRLGAHAADKRQATALATILLADDLTPSDTAMLDPATTLGFCTVGGGPTSHTAILARTLGIPAALGCGPVLLDRRRWCRPHAYRIHVSRTADGAGRGGAIRSVSSSGACPYRVRRRETLE